MKSVRVCKRSRDWWRRLAMRESSNVMVWGESSIEIVLDGEGLISNLPSVIYFIFDSRQIIHVVSLLILKFTILRGEQFSRSHMASLIYIQRHKVTLKQKRTHLIILEIHLWIFRWQGITIWLWLIKTSLHHHEHEYIYNWVIRTTDNPIRLVDWIGGDIHRDIMYHHYRA